MEDRIKKRQTLTHALAVAFPRGGTKDMCQRWFRQTPSHNAVASASFGSLPFDYYPMLQKHHCSRKSITCRIHQPVVFPLLDELSLHP